MPTISVQSSGSSAGRWPPGSLRGPPCALGFSASSCLLHRLGQTLSVRGEDTGEDVFSEALGRAVGQWPGAKLLDHGCVESSILGKLLLWLPPPILGLTVPPNP